MDSEYIDRHSQHLLKVISIVLVEIDEALLQHLVVYFPQGMRDGEVLAFEAYKKHFY